MRWTMKLALLLPGVLSCGSATMAPEADRAEVSSTKQMRARAPRASAPSAGLDDEMMEVEEEAKDLNGAPPPPPGKPKGEAAPEPDDAPAESSSAAVRAWFPDAFLWSPQVVTDSEGRGSVQVPIPDTLTTWRMLGLAHDKAGRQSGQVLQVRGALPTWLELRVPAWLTEGDEIGLPLQVFHQGADPLRETATVSWSGAAVGQMSRGVSLQTGDRILERLPVPVAGSGLLTVDVGLGSVDAVRKTIAVRHGGQPVRTRRAGLLSRPLTSGLATPADALGVGVIDAWVHGGALSLLAAELERLSTASGPWEGAYGQALARHLEALAHDAGATLDTETLRRVRLLSWQRLRRQASSVDAASAAHLLQGMGPVPDGGLEAELRDRLVRTIVSQQRGDGTWGEGSSTLSAILVRTAAIGSSLPEEHPSRARAAGALERFAGRFDDAYVASVVLASGLVSADTADTLAATVAESLTVEADGRARVAIGPDAHSVWWGRPTPADALAWAALALQGRDEARHSAAIATLIEGYDATSGFGAGFADPAVLRAVAQALPVSTEPVTVRMLLDGTVVAEGTVDPTQPFAPARLVADVPRGTGRVEVVADPPISVLAAGFEHTVYVPWADASPPEGVTMEVEVPELRVGQPGILSVTLAAPARESLVARIGLPPGVEAVAPTVDKGRVDVRGDQVFIETAVLGTGEIVEMDIEVRGSFAGRLHSAPHAVGYSANTLEALPPDLWWIR